MILRFYFSLLRESAVFMHNFFSFFPLFFKSRNTLLDAAFHNDPNSVEKRILSIDASEIPGKISRTALNLARHVCAEERKTVNSDVTSSHVFIRETFRSLSSENRTSFFSTLIFSNIDRSLYRPKRSSKREKGRKERREKYTVTRRMPISPTRGRTCDLSAAIFYRPSHFHRPRESWWLAFTPDSSPSILTNLLFAITF